MVAARRRVGRALRSAFDMLNRRMGLDEKVVGDSRINEGYM